MTRFFLLYDPRDASKPFRLVGTSTFGRPWSVDENFPTEAKAADRALELVCAEPGAEFHDLTR